jgi:hypothetical protein
LFATDTLSQCLTGFHTPENTRLPPSCPVNRTPYPSFLRGCYSHPFTG